MNTHKVITNELEWNAYLNSFPEANFLQTWQWRQFHLALGKKVEAIVIETDAALAMCLIVYETAKRGRYLAVAGGPLIKGDLEIGLSLVTESLKEIGSQHKAVFVRVRPQLLDSEEIRHLFASHSYQISPMHLTADLTLQLDLEQSSSQLLQAMRKTTRYEIKKGDSLGLKVEFSTNPDDIKEFHDYQQILSKKHDFVPFSYNFLSQQFKAFVAADKAWLVKAYYQDRLLAAAFVILSLGEGVYHYGISTKDNSKLPGSPWLQWQIIQFLKTKNAKTYNFWGVAPKDAPVNHRFAGVSLFKRGFGGREVAYLPAHDLPISKLYPLVAGFEALRARQRRLV